MNISFDILQTNTYRTGDKRKTPEHSYIIRRVDSSGQITDQTTWTRCDERYENAGVLSSEHHITYIATRAFEDDCDS